MCIRDSVKGAPIVKDNTANGKPSNLYICVSSSGPLLTIDAEGLTTDVQIGVSTDASCPVLLAGGMQTDYSAYFIPDDANTFVFYTNQALTLCAKPTATLEGDTLTITTGRMKTVLRLLSEILMFPYLFKHIPTSSARWTSPTEEMHSAASSLLQAS